MELMITVIVVIVSAAYTILQKLSGKKYEKYEAYVHMAFAWVEKTVPDDYGAKDNDPVYAKMMHKVDMFTQKFRELSNNFTGKQANKNMIEWAMKMASELASKK